jgi:hypothetical protein
LLSQTTAKSCTRASVFRLANACALARSKALRQGIRRTHGVEVTSTTLDTLVPTRFQATLSVAWPRHTKTPSGHTTDSRWPLSTVRTTFWPYGSTPMSTCRAALLSPSLAFTNAFSYGIELGGGVHDRFEVSDGGK